MIAGRNAVMRAERAAKVGWRGISQPLGDVGNGKIGIGEQLPGNFATQAVAVCHGRNSVSFYKLSSQLTLTEVERIGKILDRDGVRIM